MTVGAYWAQVSDRINHVLVPDVRQWGEVMGLFAFLLLTTLLEFIPIKPLVATE